MPQKFTLINKMSTMFAQTEESCLPFFTYNMYNMDGEIEQNKTKVK